MENNSSNQTYNALKEYVLYIPKTNENQKGGFINITDGNFSIVEYISNAIRLTSVEANREAVKFINANNLIPFKMKICDYKNYTFFND